MKQLGQRKCETQKRWDKKTLEREGKMKNYDDLTS